MHPLDAAYKKKHLSAHSPYGRRPFTAESVSVGAAARHGIFSMDSSLDNREKGPYPLNIIKTSHNPDADILAGRATELEERMRSDKKREFRWTVEVVVAKSHKNKLRGITFSVWEPQAAPHDKRSFQSVGDMLAHRQERQKYNARAVFYGRGLLDELETLENPDHPMVRVPDHPEEIAGFRNLNFTVPEFIKVLQDIPNLAKSKRHDPPDDNTIIRLTLDLFYGYVLNLGQLKTDIGRQIVTTFLEDCIHLFEKSGRMRVFDANQERYVMGSEELFEALADKVERMPKYDGLASFRDNRGKEAPVEVS